MKNALLCTHFHKGNYQSTKVNEFYFATGTTLFCVNTALATRDDFKTWLTENPIEVVYELAAPAFTPLDTESQKTLNRLKTFNGATSIEVDSKIPPSEVKVKYGTSEVGALVLQLSGENNIDKIERAEMKTQLNELAVMIVAMGGEINNV